MTSSVLVQLARFILGRNWQQRSLFVLRAPTYGHFCSILLIYESRGQFNQHHKQFCEIKLKSHWIPEEREIFLQRVVGAETLVRFTQRCATRASGFQLNFNFSPPVKWFRSSWCIVGWFDCRHTAWSNSRSIGFSPRRQERRLHWVR